MIINGNIGNITGHFCIILKGIRLVRFQIFRIIRPHFGNKKMIKCKYINTPQWHKVCIILLTNNILYFILGDELVILCKVFRNVIIYF